MPELVIMQALSAPVERDGWAWLQYALSIVATVTGIVVFSQWALERRRRPEVRFYWRLSLDGDSTHLANWEPDEVPEIKAGQPLLVGAAIQNTGDKAGSDTLINFVAPDCFHLCQREEPDQEPAHSGNPTAGLPPDNRVVFFAPRVEPWAPPHWHMRYYRLKYVGDPPLQPLPLRLLFAVSDSGFNSRGWRRVPSIVPPLEFQGAPAGTLWPPTRSTCRTMRWVRAEPRGRVACVPGERSDVRDRIVVPADEGQTSVPGPAREQSAEPQ